MISLLLHESKVKQRMSVNNKDIIHTNAPGLLLKRLYQSMLSL